MSAQENHVEKLLGCRRMYNAMLAYAMFRTEWVEDGRVEEIDHPLESIS